MCPLPASKSYVARLRHYFLRLSFASIFLIRWTFVDDGAMLLMSRPRVPMFLSFGIGYLLYL